jgi:thiol:disulfide interchange protein
MKKIFLFVLSIMISLASIAGPGSKRVQFSACFKPTAPGEGEIVVTAKIEKDWHIFSFDPGGDGTSIATTVKFLPTKDVTLVGKVREEGKLIKEEIKELETIINYYKNEVKYIQKIKYKKLGEVKGTVYYQACNEGMCDRDGTTPFTSNLSQTCDGKKIAGAEEATKDTTPIAKKNDTAEKANVAVAATPTIASTNVNNNDSANNASIVNTTDFSSDKNLPAIIAGPMRGKYGKYGNPVSDCGEAEQKVLSPWLAFLYGILGGFAGLFFPCTLPMIPMTISFFLKGNQSKREGVRKGILYGFSIFLVYFLMSLPFLLFNVSRDSLSNVATNVPLNLVYFVVFMAFAFSLFGFYDISLPSGLASKIDSKGNTQSFVGIFFMALTLAIVSFSCTGPILGLVLGNVKQPGLITPAMSGFGLGLGLPFALFAMFPNLLKAMPKSGSWLTTLKVVFGFIEIAFALKFASNADLTLQAGLLKRELFMALWIILSVLTGLYFINKFTPKKGYENIPVGTPSKIMAVIMFLFAGYLSLDFFGIEPKLVSGFPPPKFYSYFHKEEKLKNGTTANTHTLSGIKIYLSLEEAMDVAKKEGKPVMIDFTGWACINCRRMEENVWITPDVYSKLKNDYIIASLYVDDKRALPSGSEFYSAVLKSPATTIGDKWFDLSLRHFNSASQPFYALIDPKTEQILNTPVAYTPDPKQYDKWLACGITNFKSLQGK